MDSAEAWVDEFATTGPDFQEAKAAVEVSEEAPIDELKLKLRIDPGGERAQS